MAPMTKRGADVVLIIFDYSCASLRAYHHGAARYDASLR